MRRASADAAGFCTQEMRTSCGLDRKERWRVAGLMRHVKYTVCSTVISGWWSVSLSCSCASGGKECCWGAPGRKSLASFSALCTRSKSSSVLPGSAHTLHTYNFQGRTACNHHVARRHCCSRVLGHAQAVSLRVRGLPVEHGTTAETPSTDDTTAAATDHRRCNRSPSPR